MKWITVFLCITCLAKAADLVELPLPKSNQVTIKWMFATGSVDDPAGKQGLANLTAEFMAGGGTKDRTKKELDDFIYPMAPDLNLSTDKEAIVFTATVHQDHLDAFYTAAKDLILAPRFDENDFKRVKKGILKRINRDIPNSNDEVLSKRILDALMYGDHPYGYLVEGTAQSVEQLTAEDAKSFYADFFTQKRLTIGLAGGYDDAFKKRVLADAAHLAEGTLRSMALKPAAMPEGIQVRIVAKPNTFGSAIFMGYPLKVDRSDDVFAALMVAQSYLGEHRKSYGLLYDKMRSQRSLNYGDYAYIEWYPSGHSNQLPLSGYPRGLNFFSIWIRPVQIAKQFEGIEDLDPPALGNGHFVIRQALRELDLLVKNGMDQEDFERTRKFLMGYLNLYIQSQERRLGFLMDSRFYGREDYVSEMVALLDQLTLDEVNQAIRKYFQAENFYVAIITDTTEAEKLAETLRTNGSAPIVYKPVVRSGLAKKILDEDNLIDAYKLNVKKVEVVPSEGLFAK